MSEAQWKYSNTYNQPTAGEVWYLKIQTGDWNINSETIYLRGYGNNSGSTVILKTGSRHTDWWGYVANYEGTNITGVKKIVSNSDDVYIRMNSTCTKIEVKTTFSPRISASTDSSGYINVPGTGGFFANRITVPTITGNASTSTALATARTIWGQSFNGTANITGHMYSLGGNMYLSGDGRFQFLTSTSGAAPISVRSIWIGNTYTNSDSANYIYGTAGRIYFGGNFHIDSLGSNKTYINHYSANDVVMVSGSSQGKVGIGTATPSYKLHVTGDIYANGGWLRTSGNAGWYNETYGGGLYMSDSTYIRNYNGKATRLDNLCLGADNNSYRLYVNGSSLFNGVTESIAGTISSSTAWTYPGGGYYATANPNMRFIGDGTYGISTIEFVSQKNGILQH